VRKLKLPEERRIIQFGVLCADTPRALFMRVLFRVTSRVPVRRQGAGPRVCLESGECSSSLGPVSLEPPSNGDTACTTCSKTWLYSFASLSEDDLRAINVLKPPDLFVTNPPHLGDSAGTISFSSLSSATFFRAVSRNHGPCHKLTHNGGDNISTVQMRSHSASPPVLTASICDRPILTFSSIRSCVIGHALSSVLACLPPPHYHPTRRR